MPYHMATNTPSTFRSIAKRLMILNPAYKLWPGVNCERPYNDKPTERPFLPPALKSVVWAVFQEH